MRAIDALGDDLTIIIIAHRLTTLRNCDPIIEVGGGRVVNSGTHEALGLASHSFGAPGPA